MAFRYSVRFSGAGAHGLIQAARILAEAAAIYDDKIAAESCSYGPEARGSASRAEVIVSDAAIDYPRAETIDLLVALTQDAFDRYGKDLKPAGTLLIDAEIEISNGKPDWRVFLVPFAELAAQECGNAQVVPMIALGFLAAITDVVSRSSIRQAILARIPKESESAYLRAFDLGLNAAVSQAAPAVQDSAAPE